MAKNCKHFLRIQKLSPFFVPYGDHLIPPWGVLFMLSIEVTSLHWLKSEMEQIYAYDFVKKGYFRLLTLFLKYYPLDKHFKHYFKIFRPIFNNLI